MQWDDTGIILSTRKHGEKFVIMHLLTQQHGNHAGLVRINKKEASHYQPGNLVEVTWKSRLEEQLGQFTLQLQHCVAADLFDDPLRLTALISFCTLAEKSMEERDPHPHIYHHAVDFLHHLKTNEQWQEHYVHFEMTLLQELGFGLDLTQCAAGGDNDSLCYVSPKSGCAVSKAAGAPYHDRLLPLPSFLTKKSTENAEKQGEIIDGMTLTGYFLEKYIFFASKGALPIARDRLVKALDRHLYA